MSAMVLGGRYQVQDKIGAGGMATVFRGLDEVLGRTVAIKTMLPQYASDPSFAARFKQEAQAAAALQSPYIVSVYDWGKDADTYYIVMEYLRGTDLKSGIRKHGALDCKKVAQIGSQIAQALSVAHRHDIIHRDIKPQNIMVQPDGNIKVMDFGIARAKNSHLTQDNSVLGTAHYVSPEQTQGKELGPTTDIYSLGIVMYEAATGQVPFQGDDAISVALKQVNEQPKPPSQLNPKVDPSLESIILKCMQKDPAARFQTADELYRTLRDYLAGRMASVNTATAMLPAQPTNKLERGAGVVPATAANGTKGSTASMPRVERVNRYRGQSATEQAAQQEAERERKHRRNVILGTIGAIVLFIAVAAAIVSVLGSGTAMKTVPNVVSQTQERAIEILEGEGFVVGTPELVYSDNYEEGIVCGQDPSAFREAAQGSTVTIKVSRGPAPIDEVEVPDLTNMTEDKAKEELEKLNLIPKKGDDKVDEDVEDGRVCDQNREPGEMVAVGTTVTYYLSSGPEQQVIPNVVGDEESVAKQRLDALGLNVSTETANSNNYPEGTVISVNPDVGTPVDKGSSVTIVISLGPEIKTINVPSVIGQDYISAKSQLEALGLVVSITSGHDPSAAVTYQSLIGEAYPGSSIVLSTQPQYTGGGTGGNTGGETSGGGTSTEDPMGGGGETPVDPSAGA